MKYDSAHSLYLLGQKFSSTPSLFQQYSELIKKCKKEGEFLSFEDHSEWLSCYERDAQPIHAKLPLLVFQPYTVANIAPFIQMCHQMGLPVTTRCGGTGLAGSCVPAKEGVVLLTGHLKQIKDYDGKRGTLLAEPGVTIRQLHAHISPDGWHFPLSLTTEGVAGIAGCLSSHSRSYHQQQQFPFEAIKQIHLIDGQGQFLEVPPPLVCGAEGLWGVIVGMKMQLKRNPSHQQEFLYSGSWQNILSQLPLLRSLHSLTFVTWLQNQFYLGLEGENWRLPNATAYLTRCLPGIQETKNPFKKPNKAFLPSYQTFVSLSSVFNAHQLPEASSWSLEKAYSLQLECIQQADLLAGSLHLILQAKENIHSFARKIEQFFVLWTDFVDRQKGSLSSCHGVGMQMRPYMPPFWTDESQQIWYNLQAAFDPKNLFGKERFFPARGKSLERVRGFEKS